MRLNSLSPAAGSRPAGKRVGRGIGSGLGKTCGRGHKGQHSRAGGYHKTGFEGGQMPVQRRLPKIGFRSRMARRTTALRLHELAKVGDAEVIDLAALQAAGLVTKNTARVRVFASGTITRPIVLKGVKVSRGARELIENAGGRVED